MKNASLKFIDSNKEEIKEESDLDNEAIFIYDLFEPDGNGKYVSHIVVDEIELKQLLKENKFVEINNI